MRLALSTVASAGCRGKNGDEPDAAAMALETLIDLETDHVLILDLGPADDVELAVESLGKTFAPIERRAVVI